MTIELNRITTLLLLIASPIMGALYVVLLPVVGIFAILWIASEAAGKAVRTAWTNRTQILYSGR